MGLKGALHCILLKCKYPKKGNMKVTSTLVLVRFLDHSFINMKEKIKGMRRIMLEVEEGGLRVGEKDGK